MNEKPSNSFEEEVGKVTLETAEQIDTLIAEIDSVLSKGRFQSEEEMSLYLAKLYAFYTTSGKGSPQLREMIDYIETEYGGE